MPITKNYTITFRPSERNKTIKATLKKLAKDDNRNLNNYLEMMFLEHIKSRKP